MLQHFRKEQIPKLVKAFDERKGSWRRTEKFEIEKVELLEGNIDSKRSNVVVISGSKGDSYNVSTDAVKSQPHHCSMLVSG